MNALKEKTEVSYFLTTQWTQIIEVIRGGDEQKAAKALEDWCRHYWKPIFQFILRRGYSPQQARDLTQDFITKRILEHWNESKTFLHRANRKSGNRFRSFLSHVLIRFLQDVSKERDAARHGGGIVPVSIDDIDPTASATTADNRCREFDMLFAQTLLEKACEKLRHSKQHLAILRGQKKIGDVAGELGMSEDRVKVAYHRFRRKLAESIRDEVARSVGPDENEVREEIRYLMSLF